MLNLFLILAALTGLPALTEVGRVLMSLLCDSSALPSLWRF